MTRVLNYIVLPILLLVLISCDRMTGTIDDPYYIGYRHQSTRAGLYFSDNELRLSAVVYGEKDASFPLTNATKGGFDLLVTSPTVKGKFIRLSKKGCDGGGGEYKEVILYDLELQYYPSDMTVETYRGSSSCE